MHLQDTRRTNGWNGSFHMNELKLSAFTPHRLCVELLLPCWMVIFLPSLGFSQTSARRLETFRSGKRSLLLCFTSAPCWTACHASTVTQHLQRSWVLSIVPVWQTLFYSLHYGSDPARLPLMTLYSLYSTFIAKLRSCYYLNRKSWKHLLDTVLWCLFALSLQNYQF